MAKPANDIDPEELLSQIKEGAVKSELLKKYRAREEDLAQMLLTFYKGGKLTKEEFNDFFKGAPLRKKNDSQMQARPEDDAPSDIVKSLSKMFGIKTASEPPPEPKVELKPDPVPEPKAESKPPAKPETNASIDVAFKPVELKAPAPVAVAQPENQAESASSPPAVLEKIYARLYKIEKRLSAIEKKILNS
jgi:hypothetical protein